MIVFTIIGVLVYWVFCWHVGCVIAMALDAKARIDDLFKPVTNDLETLIAALGKAGVEGDAKGGV